jgi:NitT/TauT family transport system substrate-binding protein
MSAEVRSPFRLRPALAGLLLAAVAGLPGCGERESQTIRIGMNPWPAWEHFYLAQEQGLYAKEGVDVRIVEFSSLGDAKRAFERGQVEAYLGTLVEVSSTSADGGREPAIVLVTDSSDGADQIIAHAPIATAADLVGKRVAVEMGSLNVYLLARALESCNRTLDDVTMVNLDQLSMLDAFKRREVDAIVAYPPVSIAANREQDARQVFNSSRIPDEIVDVLAVDSRIVAERPDDVSAICRAYARAVELGASRSAECMPIMARREGLSAAEFEASLRDGIRLVGAGQQREFLRAGGSLDATWDIVVRLLQQTDQLRATPPNRIAHEFVAQAAPAP